MAIGSLVRGGRVLLCLWLLASGAATGAGNAAPTSRSWTAADYVAAPEELDRAVFASPPGQYTMVPLWSWNSTLRPEEIRRQVRLCVEQHVYAAFMHTREGLQYGETPYFSPGWWKAVEATVDEARKAGFHAWIYDEDRWPSGSAGGRVVAADPVRNRALRLWLVTRDVRGPAALDIHDPEVVSVVAGRIVDRGNGLADLVDLTSGARGPKDRATWSAPEGNWRIVTAHAHRITDKEAINYLRKETAATFLDITHEEYRRRFGPEFGTVIPGLFFDEIHNSGGDVVWTDGFEHEFRRRMGYDLVPLLPGLRYDIGPQTEKIRCDYFEVYAALYEEAWFKQTAQWCRRHGLLWTGHTAEPLAAYKIEGDYFRTMRHLTIPLTDNEDFRYVWPRVIGAWQPRQMASVANLYGRRRVGAEALGGAGWTFTLESGRYGLHMLAAYGLNFFVPHLFHYAIDRPENDGDWPNSWFYQNPYWKYFHLLADDTARLSYAMSCGQPVRNTAILFPIANLWSGRGGGRTEELVGEFVRRQIEFDLVDTDSILARKLTRYRAIVLPGVEVLETGVLDKLEEFVGSGGALVMMRPMPIVSREKGRDDRTFADRIEKLLRRGQGVIEAGDLEDVATAVRSVVRQPLVVVKGDEETLRHEHRRTRSQELFWLANEDAAEQAYTLRLRPAGRTELWETASGSVRELPASAERDAVTVSLSIGPKQGVLLVVDRTALPAASGPAVAGGAAARTLRLEGPWRFLPVGGALDEQWKIDVKRAAISIPVARFQPVRRCSVPVTGARPAGLAELLPVEGLTDKDDAAFASSKLDDSRWRLVQLLDDQETSAGASLYLSGWDAAWITFYDPLPRFAVPGRGKVVLRTQIPIEGRVVEASFHVAATGPATVTINSLAVASVPRPLEAVALQPVQALRNGSNRIAIEVSPLKAIADATDTDPPSAAILEGWIRTVEGRLYRVVTDRTWEVAAGSRSGEAWEYLRPPQPAIGEPAGSAPATMPRVAWYRVALPPGTVEVELPPIEGKVRALVDGKPLGDLYSGKIDLGPRSVARLLALRVELAPGQRGLLGEIVAHCVPVEMRLAPWSEYAMPWYSGRALYQQSFDLPDGFLSDGARVTLDLGDVRHSAEVWVNGRLAGVRAWRPYEVDVTGLVKQGRNEIAVVVANLLANRMFYRQFNSARANLRTRSWHDGNIRRDAHALVSGLLSSPVLRASGL